ncbi:ABC transporter permease [Fictibacillus phosphorivorans]|uniref:ABC transporter permease n=1 Tax=Fictibacillus phosphorivorans TaxID=1221500 RepID=UPI003CE790E0
MKGLMRYHLITYFRTYKYVPPLSVFIMMLVINYTYVPNPILDSYSYTSIMLFFIIWWFTITIFHAEDEGQKQITIMHAKNKKVYYISLIFNCTLTALILSIAAVAYPVVFNAFSPGLHTVHLVMGFLAHFSLAVLSIALSSFFTRGLVKNNVNSWWGVISILIGSLVMAVEKIEIFKIKLISWVFPPLQYSMEIMSVDDKIISFPVRVYVQFVWIFVYSIILMIIFISVMEKRRSL